MKSSLRVMEVLILTVLLSVFLTATNASPATFTELTGDSRPKHVRRGDLIYGLDYSGDGIGIRLMYGNIAETGERWVTVSEIRTDTGDRYIVHRDGMIAIDYYWIGDKNDIAGGTSVNKIENLKFDEDGLLRSWTKKDGNGQHKLNPGHEKKTSQNIIIKVDQDGNTNLSNNEKPFKGKYKGEDAEYKVNRITFNKGTGFLTDHITVYMKGGQTLKDITAFVFFSEGEPDGHTQKPVKIDKYLRATIKSNGKPEDGNSIDLKNIGDSEATFGASVSHHQAETGNLDNMMFDHFDAGTQVTITKGSDFKYTGGYEYNVRNNEVSRNIKVKVSDGTVTVTFLEDTVIQLKTDTTMGQLVGLLSSK